MRKVKYFFDPQTLSYQRVKKDFKYYFIRSLGVIATSLVFAFALFFFSTGIVNSPKELLLLKENEDLKEHISHIDKKVKSIETELLKISHKDENIYRTIFEAEPPKEKVEFEDPELIEYSKLSTADFLEKISNRIVNLEKQVGKQSKSMDYILKLAENKKKYLAAIPSIQPVFNKDLNRLASGFGYRIDPFYRTRKFHAGTDFSAPKGTEVYATADGVVLDVKSEIWGYGNSIQIKHGFGYVTLYAHLSKFHVKKGQKVVRGQLIGRIGNTGKSTAPHLHYEVRFKDEPMNPTYFFHNDITDEEFKKLLELSSSPNQSFD
jgi:murein DD-endopeptidase MepM/ murein hydrolase activator NlpD